MNKWFALLGGFGLGAAIAGYIINKYNEKKFDEVIDDIYNECYAEVKAEMENKPLDEVAEKVAKATDTKTLRAIIKDYKPPLNEMEDMFDQNPHMVEKEEEEDVGLSFEEANNVVLKEGNDVYFITQKEFEEENLHFHKEDVFWYSVDNVFTNEEDQIIDDEDPIFDLKKDVITSKVRTEDGCYIRCVHLSMDFEVHHVKGAYSDIAYETYKERERRIGKRKFKEAE